MMFFIYIVFIAVMVLFFLSGMVFIAIKSFDTKEPLKKKTFLFLKKMGVYVPVAVAVFYLAYRLLMGYFEKECGPNPEVVRVMKPVAEGITNYILENGIPESLADIEGLPYKLYECKREMDNVEKCYFNEYNNKYEVEIYNLSSLNLHVYNEISETGLRFRMEYDEKNKKWILMEKNIAYSSKDDGICNPMRM